MYATLMFFPATREPLTLEGFKTAAEKGLAEYEKMAGLRMKAYIQDPETKQVGGFYVWENEAAFRGMYDDPHWREWVIGRYGGLPSYRPLNVPILVDNDPK